MKTSCSYEVYSHPEKLLSQHLGNVTFLSCQNIYNLINIFDKYNEKILYDVVYLINISHDLGKSTNFFQEYLKEQNDSKRKSLKVKSETNHSLISAIFAFFLVSKCIQEFENQDHYFKILPFIAFLLVKRHHGNFKESFTREFAIDDNEIPVLKNQIANINKEYIDELYNFLLREVCFKNVFSEFISKFDLILKEIKQIKRYYLKLRDNLDLQDFFLTLFLFSLLIDSDKLDAGIGFDNVLKIKKIVEKFNLPDAVDNYKKLADLKDSKINDLREKIYQEVVTNEVDLSKKIYSINVPTGTGKTFTSLSFAFKLKDILIKEQGFNPKIIYCLPFTSIIDQNYQVIEEILKSNNEEITTDKLLKHHHLAEIEYKTLNDDEYEFLETDKSLLLTENWMSSIVVTTFVQFFHSIISNRNKSLKKFHNITNSIVILDEIQAIPYKYWKLVEEVLTKFSEVFNTYFILVTATQPLIFKEENVVNLIQNREKYFKSDELNRIVLENKLEPQPLMGFKETLIKDIEVNYPVKSFLIILNTIKSSQEIFKALQDNLKDKNIELKYLSTTVLPFERQKIIEEIRNRKESGKRFIVVSTQVVEAGVDIDLDIVYRDLAPLDCIFQSAGRCNRNKNNNKNGIVKIFCLENENHNNKPFAEYVYSPVLLDVTKEILKKKDKYEEKEFFDLAKSYYQKLDPHLPDNERVISNSDGNKILKSMRKLDFEGIKEFKLIENCESMDFFIELDDDATRIKNEIVEILNTKFEKGFERKHKLLEKKKDFYKYVVSIRLKKNNNLDFLESQYQVLGGKPVFIPKSEIKDFYQTGGIGLYFEEKGKSSDSGIMIV